MAGILTENQIAGPGMLEGGLRFRIVDFEDAVELAAQRLEVGGRKVVLGGGRRDLPETLPRRRIELGVPDAELLLPEEAPEEAPVLALLEEGWLLRDGREPAGFHPLAEVEGGILVGEEDLAGLLGQPRRLREEIVRRFRRVPEGTGYSSVGVRQIFSEELILEQPDDAGNDILGLVRLVRLEGHLEIHELNPHPEGRLFDGGRLVVSTSTEGLAE